MAKVSIKYGKLTPFGGIYFVNKAFNALSLGNNIPDRRSNTMKNGLLKDMRFTCIEEAILAVAGAVDFYNNERPHMSIDMKTTDMAALCEGKIKKRRFSHRKKTALKIPERDKVRQGNLK